jgi:hypothetical protein
MPMFDMKCATCETVYDMFVKPGEQRVCPECGQFLYKVFVPGHATAMIGDECDIMIKHGLCNEDGSARRYTSKQEIAREAERRGLTNVVQHRGTKSGDKSQHTSRWV